MTMKKIFILSSLAIAFNLSANVMPVDTEKSFQKLNRYTNINTGYSAQRTNPLNTVVSIKYPPSIKVLGAGIDVDETNAPIILISTDQCPGLPYHKLLVNFLANRRQSYLSG